MVSEAQTAADEPTAHTVTTATLVEPPDTPTYSFSVERDLDLVSLDITFTNFTYSKNAAGVVSLVPGSGAVIAVQFPPQAIGEAAYPWSPTSTNPNWPVDPPPVLSVMSGPSRLCFTTTTPVTFSNPMSVNDLLDWSNWTLLVPATAEVPSPTPAPTPADPTVTSDQTYIEYPYGLYLSPTVYVRPLTLGGTLSQTPDPRIATPPSLRGFSTIFSPTGGVKNQQTQVCDCWSVVLSQTNAEGAALVPSVAGVWARDYYPSTPKATQVPTATPQTYISYAT
jgi:hypothetical protein